MELRRGQVAVVTGAASGIGFALADAFASRGLSVVMADVQPDALHEASERITAHGVDVLPLRVDVSKAEEVEHLAAATVERFGAVHVLCNNAGVAASADAFTGPLAAWEWVMGVNFWGVVHGLRAFLPHLVMSGEAHVVNTASIAGVWPGLSAVYDASKHAVVAVSEDFLFAMQDAGLPVGVSCLCPGWVRTRIHEAQRNWPGHLGAPPEGPPGSEVVAAHLERAITEGLTPAAVAAEVVAAITDGRYWVFPGEEFFQLGVRRWERIIERLDPQRPPQLPGMPPREQIVAEVFAAMAAAADGGGAP